MHRLVKACMPRRGSVLLQDVGNASLRTWETFKARSRAIPTRQGIRSSEQFRVRKDRVDTDSKLTLRHGSRLHHIGIGRNWAGTRILMLIHELNIRIITETGGELIRELVLDTTRD
jgi:hypothetical protein